MSSSGRILARLRKPFSAALLLYLFFFLNVLLPGHTRGSVTLDGKRSPCCCCGDAGPMKSTPTAPSQRDREHCAICDFAARVITPEVFVLRLDPLGLLERLPPLPPFLAPSLDRISTCFSTGPPAVVA